MFWIVLPVQNCLQRKSNNYLQRKNLEKFAIGYYVNVIYGVQIKCAVKLTFRLSCCFLKKYILKCKKKMVSSTHRNVAIQNVTAMEQKPTRFCL